MFEQIQTAVVFYFVIQSLTVKDENVGQSAMGRSAGAPAAARSFKT